MHGSLAVAAVHDRYLGQAPTQRCLWKESFHAARCTTLFRQWLSAPIKEEHKDLIWAVAGTLSILAFSSTTARCPEEAWPLGAPDPSDLEWLRLAAGKMTLWELVNPLRPGSVFRAMFEQLSNIIAHVPARGVDGLPDDLALLCGIHEASTHDANPYFTVAHSLSRILTLPQKDDTLGKVLRVSHHMRNEFEHRLWNKDPVALLLLCLWYTKARHIRWWIHFRARYEIPAICIYLQRYHKDNRTIQRLIPWEEVKDFL
ncbi:hypothetical protein SPI_08385 [Niveomyces insectorum RCEF 264]|uniref:C6 finger domain protein n=1 Tax=Niveomyces insectorum RCEF 264 TaxID=1081102 RepID=A0A162MF22_9HYPO|nr:hypothetical protein SPI_08385 [Niveomyces insectorum RCEF 264]